MRRLLPLCLIILLGQGCFSVIGELPSAEPIGQPSPEGFVRFTNGFGPIPGQVPGELRRPGPYAEVTWSQDLPTVPTAVTVIRQHNPIPSSSLLQNLTTALRIPAGALERQPKTEELNIAWKDDSGYRWNYDARQHRVSFDRIQKSAETYTTSLPNDQELYATVLAFLDGRGISRSQMSEPSLFFSWNIWWEQEQKAGRCINKTNQAALLLLSDADAYVFPRLPSLGTTECLRASLPTKHVINFYLVQDGLEVFDSTEQVLAAQIEINAANGEIRSGWFTIPEDADRSNYPAISEENFSRALSSGGITGLSNFRTTDRILITNFEQILYQHSVNLNGDDRHFFIPSIRATGFVNGDESNRFEAIVPLLRSTEYES